MFADMEKTLKALQSVQLEPAKMDPAMNAIPGKNSMLKPKLSHLYLARKICSFNEFL